MERRYEARLEEMLEDAEVSPEMLGGMLTRLETFVEPFAAALDEPAQRRHALEYLTGLLSNLEHKTGEGGDRLPSRSATAGHPEVHRACALGPPALARDAGRPSRRAVG